MTRFYDKAGWLLSSLGIALLVCGLVLVPQNRLLADDEETAPGACWIACRCQAAPPNPCIDRICNDPPYVTCNAECYCDENFLGYCNCYNR